MKHFSMFFQLLSSAICFLISSATIPALAQWSHDPTVNNPIAATTYGELAPASVCDGAGGAIITWEIAVASGDVDVYAQRINAAGYVLWQTNGRPISIASHEQEYPQIVSDGAGGAIITWQDYRSGSNWDVYAQRINSIGLVQWTDDGVPISTAANSQEQPAIVSDGAGGAIITWQDNRSGNYDIYAQRINASGVVQWTTNGAPVRTWPGTQDSPQIASDGAGGAIITWEDNSSGDWDIFAQKINGAGVLQWSSFSVAISTPAYNQLFPKIVSDGAGGAVIAWYDYRPSVGIAAQKVNASGTVQWTTNGFEFGLGSSNISPPAIASDGAGGVIITFGYPYDFIYAVRINSLGTLQWASGIGVGINAEVQPQIVSDGAGGALITWEDVRGYFVDTVNYWDIYAEKVNAAGVMQWDTLGVPISTYLGNQRYPILVSDGSGGAIISWVDSRNGNYDIYAQKIDRYSNLGNLNPSIVKVKDVINDQGGQVALLWKPSYLDTWPNLNVTSYAIYLGTSPSSAIAGSVALTQEEYDKIERNVIARSPANAGMTKQSDLPHASQIATSRDKRTRHDASSEKVYLKLPRTPNGLDTLYWEFITSVKAEWLDGYSYDVPTPSDSGPQGAARYYFMVRAKTSTPVVFWNSNVDSGYSVDNLPPHAVASLAAQAQSGPSVNVHWSKDVVDPDVGYYEVHRSTTDGFTAGPSTKIGQTADTMLVDASPVSGSTNYYRIVTVDIHGNVSSPSAQASAGLTTTAQYSVANKWNLVSVPLTVSDYSKTTLFPSAVTSAFAYQSGYSAQATLANGVGYWLKFSGAQSVSMTGLYRAQDSITVQTGWNLIGSISSPVAVSSVTSNPGGIVTSDFYGYTGSYAVAGTVEPGKGYWVKVNQNGKLILSSLGNIPSANHIRIIPTEELPPAPPDVAANTNNPIIPSEYSLAQNYPNPFNPTTDIHYQLPVESYVTLKVYSMLGEEVARLVDGIQDAGYKSVEWDASGISSGMYIYKLNAGTFSEVRKMLLLR